MTWIRFATAPECLRSAVASVEVARGSATGVCKRKVHAYIECDGSDISLGTARGAWIRRTAADEVGRGAVGTGVPLASRRAGASELGFRPLRWLEKRHHCAGCILEGDQGYMQLSSKH